MKTFPACIVLAATLATALTITGGPLAAQTAVPLVASRLTQQGDPEQAGLTVHRDPLGRPCLKFRAFSRAHVVNPDVYDHTVSVYNACSKPIKLKICYLKSDTCTDVQVQPLKRQDVIIGIFPRIKYFRYSWTEKF